MSLSTQKCLGEFGAPQIEARKASEPAAENKSTTKGFLGLEETNVDT